MQEQAMSRSEAFLFRTSRLVAGAAIVCATAGSGKLAFAAQASLSAASAREANALSQPFANDGPVNSVQAAGTTRMDFVAGSQGKEASISYGDFSKRPWRLVLTSPLDNDSGNANFVDLDGLTNATRLTAESRLYQIWRVPSGYDLGPRIKPFCAELAAAIPDSAPSGLLAIRKQASPDKDGNASCDIGYFDRAAKDFPQVSQDLKDKLTKLREGAYATAALGVWFGISSVKVTGGRQNFDFVDVPSATKHSEHTGVWSAEASQSFYQRDLLLVAVGARYEDTYKAQKKSGTLCPVATGVTSVTCVTGALGAPNSEHNKLLFTEIKFEPKTPAGKSLGFALSPRLSYEFSKSQWLIDVPVYLLQAEKGGFLGGFQASYHEEQKDKFSASIFVGKKFSLLDQ
jgi:hypothetical protein